MTVALPLGSEPPVEWGAQAITAADQLARVSELPVLDLLCWPPGPERRDSGIAAYPGIVFEHRAITSGTLGAIHGGVGAGQPVADGFARTETGSANRDGDVTAVASDFVLHRFAQAFSDTT